VEEEQKLREGPSLAGCMNGVGVRFKKTPHPHSAGCFMPP